MTINENDGIDYFKVECSHCGGIVSNDADDTIYDEKLDRWFCCSACQCDYYEQEGLNSNDID